MRHRSIVRDSGVCGGAPSLAGTRLTCANVVYAIRASGRRAVLQVHENLVEADLDAVVRYCAGQDCVGGGDVYCYGCSLDARPSSEFDDPPEDVWTIAETLLNGSG